MFGLESYPRHKQKNRLITTRNIIFLGEVVFTEANKFLVEHLTEKKMLPKKGYVKEKADFWSRNVAAQLLMS